MTVGIDINICEKLKCEKFFQVDKSGISWCCYIIPEGLDENDPGTMMRVIFERDPIPEECLHRNIQLSASNVRATNKKMGINASRD